MQSYKKKSTPANPQSQDDTMIPDKIYFIKFFPLSFRWRDVVEAAVGKSELQKSGSYQ